LPCVIISGASGPRQEIRWSNISRLATEEKLPAPALLIVGRVAAQQVEEIGASFWSGKTQDRPAKQISVI